MNTHDDTAIIYGKVLSEGEKEKVIQHPQNNAEDVIQPEEESTDQKSQENKTEPHQRPKSPNDIQQSPPIDKTKPNPESQESDQLPTQKYSRSQ
jgi:hypothetical protein